MNKLKELGIEMVYEEIATEALVVPYDVVEFVTDQPATSGEGFLQQTLIVYRPLDMKDNKRFAISLKDFNTKFKKHG